MYIRNGIAYAGEEKTPLKVSGVRPLDDYKLWIRFNTGEVKIFDFSTELECPAFHQLKSKEVFDSVYIDYGVTVWNNGDIDIAPEYLYQKGIAVEEDLNIREEYDFSNARKNPYSDKVKNM